MRILFLSTYFAPDAASTGVLMTHLAEDLSGLGHEVTVVTTKPHYEGDRIWSEYRGRAWRTERKSGLSIHRLHLYVPRNKTGLAGRVLSYATWNAFSGLFGTVVGDPDIVFVPSPPLTNGLSGYAVSRLRRAPFVYNVQDIYPDVAVRLGILESRRTIGAFRALERFVYAKAAAVSVICEGFRDNLLAKGVPGGKIRVIPNFADTDFIRPLDRRGEFSRAHGLDGRFVVLFAGNVGLSQGLDRVLEAAELLAGEPEILFLIVGNGAAKAGLVETARRRRLGNVVFRPFFPYRDIPKMYASSDVGLVPLKRGVTEESVPSKVFSILAAGRPLIASVDEGSETWRLVREAGCGMCVPPEDPKALAEAILRLRRDRETGRRMGLAGRACVEKDFSRRPIAMKYDQLFKSVVEGRANG